MLRRSAFTLIELLIVVAIIGILVAIAVPNFMNAMVRAKIADTYGRMKTLHTAIAGYMVDNNMKPPRSAAYWIGRPIYFAKLTTPIAYLSSIEVAQDQFFRWPSDTPDEVQKMKWYFYCDASATYSPMTEQSRFGKDVTEPFQPTLTKAHKIGIRYILISSGPGIAGVYFPSSNPYSDDLSEYQTWAYSATNGLRSAGMIISNNIKIYQ